MMMSQRVDRIVDNHDHQELSDKARHIHELAEAYKLGYADGRMDEKHRAGDKVLRMFNQYSS
jgi:hypothetical protein